MHDRMTVGTQGAHVRNGVNSRDLAKCGHRVQVMHLNVMGRNFTVNNAEVEPASRASVAMMRDARTSCILVALITCC